MTGLGARIRTTRCENGECKLQIRHEIPSHDRGWSCNAPVACGIARTFIQSRRRWLAIQGSSADGPLAEPSRIWPQRLPSRRQRGFPDGPLTGVIEQFGRFFPRAGGGAEQKCLSEARKGHLTAIPMSVQALGRESTRNARRAPEIAFSSFIELLFVGEIPSQRFLCPIMPRVGCGFESARLAIAAPGWPCHGRCLAPSGRFGPFHLTAGAS